jgi:hypothetical protein
MSWQVLTLIVIGVCTVTDWLFKLIEWIDR